MHSRDTNGSKWQLMPTEHNYKIRILIEDLFVSVGNFCFRKKEHQRGEEGINLQTRWFFKRKWWVSSSFTILAVINMSIFISSTMMNHNKIKQNYRYQLRLWPSLQRILQLRHHACHHQDQCTCWLQQANWSSCIPQLPILFLLYVQSTRLK